MGPFALNDLCTKVTTYYDVIARSGHPTWRHVADIIWLHNLYLVYLWRYITCVFILWRCLSTHLIHFVVFNKTWGHAAYQICNKDILKQQNQNYVSYLQPDLLPPPPEKTQNRISRVKNHPCKYNPNIPCLISLTDKVDIGPNPAWKVFLDGFYIFWISTMHIRRITRVYPWANRKIQ